MQVLEGFFVPGGIVFFKKQNKKRLFSCVTSSFRCEDTFDPYGMRRILKKISSTERVSYHILLQLLHTKIISTQQKKYQMLISHDVVIMLIQSCLNVMRKENILCKMLEIKWLYYFKINASELAETSVMQIHPRKNNIQISLFSIVCYLSCHS